MKSNYLCVYAILPFFLISSVFCQADEAVLVPYMDAAVSEANPASNYAVGDLAVGMTFGLAWESIMQFDVGSLPANAVLTDAKLRLASPLGMGSGGRLQISTPSVGWSETDVIWTNRPAVTTLGDAALVVDGNNMAHLPLPTPVLAHFQEIVRRASVNRGLKLAFPSATADQLLTLRSRESASAPQLVITYTLGPELSDYNLGPGADEGRMRSAIFKTPTGTAAPLELVWNTTPGVRYSLWESPDLSSWSQVSGYPSVADALSGVHEIQTTAPNRFFKVQILDEQSPVIVSRFPDDGNFGIKRFYPGEEIGVRLWDATEVDPASISITLGSVGTFTQSDPQLTYNDGLLTLDLGGDIALGAYGALINASLTVADAFGNSATFDWSFELEKQIVPVEGLFTFGSPAAQRVGQRVPPIPTRVLADRAGGGGPIRGNDSEWSLQSVTAGSLVIAYSGSSAPVFAVDQYLTNMTPATVHEIFYRKVTSIQEDSVAKKLMLGTVDVPAWEIVTAGSVSLSEDDIAFEADADGRIIRALELKPLRGSETFSLDPIEIDWSDKTIMGLYERSDGGTGVEFGLPIADRPHQYDEEWDSKVTLKQAVLSVQPTMSISAEILPWSRKFYSNCTIEVNSVLEPEFEFIVPSIDYKLDLDNAVNKEPLFKRDFSIPLGTLLWVNVSPRLRAEASINAGLTGKVSIGAKGGYTKTMVFDYDNNREPSMEITGRDGNAYFELIEPKIALAGTAGVEFKLIPEIDVKLMNLVGFYMNIDPTLAADLNAEFNSATLVSADVGLSFNGHVNAGLSIYGVDNDILPSFEPWEVFSWEKRWYFPESLAAAPLQILMQPVGQAVPPGGNLQLSVQANHETGVTYEWRHNGRRLFADSSTLKLYGVTPEATGDYKVKIRYGAEEVDSEVARVTVSVAPQSLDQVRIDFFGAFTMNCLRLSGTAGNESGAATYTRLKDSFLYDIPAGPGGTGGVETRVALPIFLTNLRYEYVTTGTNTGRVIFTFNNPVAYPHPQATASTSPIGVGLGDMFWGGRNNAAVGLIVDIQFTNQGGFIRNATTRIRSAYQYLSVYTAPGPAVNSEFPFDVDTLAATYKLSTGTSLPTGYNPYDSITATTPASAVWSTIQGRTVSFAGNNSVYRSVAHLSVGGVGPPIPGLIGDPEESGFILVDEDNGVDFVQGVGGTYSYHRIGGDKAKMAIRYNRTVGGVTTTVNLIYDMDFESLDNGLYIDNKGVSGFFQQSMFGPR